MPAVGRAALCLPIWTVSVGSGPWGLLLLPACTCLVVHGRGRVASTCQGRRVGVVTTGRFLLSLLLVALTVLVPVVFAWVGIRLGITTVASVRAPLPLPLLLVLLLPQWPLALAVASILLALGLLRTTTVQVVFLTHAHAIAVRRLLSTLPLPLALLHVLVNVGQTFISLRQPITVAVSADDPCLIVCVTIGIDVGLGGFARLIQVLIHGGVDGDVIVATASLSRGLVALSSAIGIIPCCRCGSCVVAVHREAQAQAQAKAQAKAEPLPTARPVILAIGLCGHLALSMRQAVHRARDMGRCGARGMGRPASLPLGVGLGDQLGVGA